jgi:serine/threonine protein kinase
MTPSQRLIQGKAARYEPLFKIASGGMATVYAGRLAGAMGFQRLVAIKRPHRHLLEDPRLVEMLLHEANLASRLHHPNVVSVQDVVQVHDNVYLVMDLVEGAPLADLIEIARERDMPIPPDVAVRVLLDASAGVHAAHELLDDDGKPLGLVHRDMTPHNILVGVDGVSRVTDFGIAKCVNAQNSPATTAGVLKGKYAYMAPEYVQGRGIDRRGDVFSLAVVAWELLAGRRLFHGGSPAATMMKVTHEPAPPLSQVTCAFGDALDAVLSQALIKDPAERFATAEAFANALEFSARSVCGVASPGDVGRFVRSLIGDKLDQRRDKLRKALDEQASLDLEHESGVRSFSPESQDPRLAETDPHEGWMAVTDPYQGQSEPERAAEVPRPVSRWWFIVAAAMAFVFVVTLGIVLVLVL